MRSEIGRALRRELRQVRVDEGLKARILAGAARESGAYRRRRSRRWPGVAVAAAVILLAGSVGLLLHLRAEHPDVQRPAVLSAGGGEDTPLPTAEATDAAVVTPEPTLEPVGEAALSPGELRVEVTAFGGGVLAVECDFDSPHAVGLLDLDDEGWHAEAQPDAVAAAASLRQDLDAAAVAEWEAKRDLGERVGVAYGHVDVALAVRSEADAALTDDRPEYHFVGRDDPGQRLTLLLLDGEWTQETVGLAAVAVRREWYYDGREVLTRQLGTRDAVRLRDDGLLEVDVDAGLSDDPGGFEFELPVSGGGSASVYTGGTGWVNADTGEGAFGMRMTVIDFDGETAAILLEPDEGHSLTARIHSVASPAMVLDSADHPGAAGWIFEEVLDEEDVVDVTDEHGWRWKATLGELADMVGASDPGTEEIPDAVAE